MVISTQFPVHACAGSPFREACAAQRFAGGRLLIFFRPPVESAPKAFGASLRAKPSLKTSVLVSRRFAGYISPPVSPASGGYRPFSPFGRVYNSFVSHASVVYITVSHKGRWCRLCPPLAGD